MEKFEIEQKKILNSLMRKISSKFDLSKSRNNAFKAKLELSIFEKNFY